MKHYSAIAAFIILTLLCTVTGVAQSNRYNENWMFGNYAGMNFSGFSSGAVVGSAMSSPEGVATISDNGTGQLLFYTNGQKVWGSNHQLILNGDLLLGDASSTHSALIAPCPKSSRFFYLFTTDKEGGPSGLRYSLIDKTAGTHGGIVGGTKNILLVTPVTEKLTLLRHCDLQSYWLAAHEWGTNRFFAWHITESGINDTVVETYAGPTYDGIVENSIGAMKASPNDDMLALAITGQNRVDLYNFDNLAGMPSFMVSLDSLFQPYGTEFSSDQTFLYVSCLNGDVYQYDLQAPNMTTTRILVASSGKLTGALQQAPDGRIYITRDLDYYLGYIGAPNAPGTNCNYVENGVYLAGRLTEAGLPPYIPVLQVNSLAHFSICLGDTVTYYPQFLLRADSFILCFGDPVSGSLDTARQLPAVHLYETAGARDVKLVYYMCGAEYILFSQVCVQGIPGVYLGEDTAICSNLTYNLQAILNGLYCPALQVNYQWNTGQTGQSISITPPGQFSITATNICGTGVDTVTIDSLPIPFIFLGSDQELCLGDTAVIMPIPPPDSIFWNDGSADTVKYITSSGYFFATVINEFMCRATDDVNIVFIEPPEIGWVPEDTLICIGHPMELDAGSGFDSYLWQDGSSGTSFWVTDSGWYCVSVANLCGTDADSMYVKLEDCSLKLYVPNAFTPDADGMNDIFRAYGAYIEDFRMSLYNRWGALLFYTEDIEKGWDGRVYGEQAPEAVYAWKITYLDATGEYHNLYGTVTLLRK